MRPRTRSLARMSLLVCALAAAGARGQAAHPAPHEQVAFDFMNVLSDAQLHDLSDEAWNAYGQLTYISSWKLPFPAQYTNLNGSPNSLLPTAEQSFTLSATLFLGVRLWPGAEGYFVPEVISERPLSNLHGLAGAIQNFELQKGGSETPQVYKARLYLRQTIGFGGEPVAVDSNPMQLGTTVDSRRLVIWLGNFSALDVLDKNGVTGDPRQTFLNMAFMTYASWDFTSDARGYSYGYAVEFYWDDWAVRFAQLTPPKNPNQLPLDFRFFTYFGANLELEHRHTLWGQPGAVRLLGYRNQVFTGSFVDAVNAYAANPAQNAAACAAAGLFNYGSQNATAPDLCWVRKDNVKVGIGLDLEQFVTPDVGVFLRAMWSDGKSEVVAFNASDRSLSLGSVAKGAPWGRPFDVTGIGLGLTWLSSEHARYLALGGIDGFIGDGALTLGTEGIFELFYSFNLFRALWLTADFQLLWNPAANTARGGPLVILGARAHAEF